jgi:Alginate lyase
MVAVSMAVAAAFQPRAVLDFQHCPGIVGPLGRHRMIKYLLVFFLFFVAGSRVVDAVPTDGFAEVPFTYSIQYPYDLQLTNRYSFNNGVHSFWVYATDQPFQQGSATEPRTEMRIFNDYTNGVWQFEGDLYVPSGTTGVAVMQVFGGTTAATASQLRVYNGSLCRYTSPIMNNIYDQWIHVNVIHDANAHTVSIYLNGSFARSDADRGPATYYFKCGVYIQDNPSDRVESQWANIKVWRLAPKIRQFVMDGNGLVITGTNGTPQTVCYVVSSTNPATPPDGWNRIGTASFNSQGSCTYTDAFDPSVLQRFYRLQLP